MKPLDQATLESVSAASIEGAIYSAAAVMGSMMQSVWLFTVPDDPKSGPVQGISIQTPNDEQLMPAMIAYTRQQVQSRKPDFSVTVGHAAPANSLEDLDKMIEDVNNGDRPKTEAYAFYVEARGLTPVIFIQRYHRDEEGYVVLDGALDKIPNEVTRTNDTLNSISPWGEMTEEDQRILDSSDLQPLQIDPKVFTSTHLKMSTLFPKDLTT